MTLIRSRETFCFFTQIVAHPSMPAPADRLPKPPDSRTMDKPRVSSRCNPARNTTRNTRRSIKRQKYWFGDTTQMTTFDPDTTPDTAMECGNTAASRFENKPRLQCLADGMTFYSVTAPPRSSFADSAGRVRKMQEEVREAGQCGFGQRNSINWSLNSSSDRGAVPSKELAALMKSKLS